MKIEIDLPELPKGFEYTGEIRYPKIFEEEWAMSLYSGDPFQPTQVSPRQVILRKVKPKKPTLLECIEEKWPDKDVSLLRWTKIPDCEDEFLKFEGGDLHTEAQSMKGFAGYVYDAEDGPLLGIRYGPICVITGNPPIAVLFNK